MATSEPTDDDDRSNSVERMTVAEGWRSLEVVIDRTGTDTLVHVDEVEPDGDPMITFLADPNGVETTVQVALGFVEGVVRSSEGMRTTFEDDD